MKTKKMIFGFVKGLILIFVALVIIVPVLWMFISAFKPKTELIAYPPRFFTTNPNTKNFITLFKKQPMWNYIKNSFIYVLLMILTQVPVDAMAGYAFARLDFKGKNTLFIIVLASMMIPFQVIMIPLFLECNVLGMVDNYAGLIFPKMVNVTCIFMMRSFFISLPKSLEEAGRIDGLTEFGIFFRIMIPQCVPIMITHVVLTFSLGWNDLLWPLLMTSTKAKRMLANGLASFVGAEATEYGPAFAGAAISIVPALLLFLIGQKYFVNSVVSSSVKG